MTEINNDNLQELPEIRTCREDEIEELVDYTSFIYPSRCKTEKDRYRYKNLARFWFYRTADTYRYMMIIKEKGKIVGQTYLIPANYYWNGVKHEATWSFDLFVNFDKRKSAYGTDLMMETRSQPGDSFNTGANDASLALQRVLGYKRIGSIRKYVGVGSVFGFSRMIYPKKIPISNFPIQVKSKNLLFEKIEEIKAIAKEKPFNTELLEWGRDKEFVSWYYGSHNVNEYAIYKECGSGNYFVVRPIYHAHVPLLALVDFRCPLDKGAMFEAIVETVRKISQQLYIPFIVSSSTLAVTDRVLESSGFRSIGRPRPVMSKKKWKGMEERIDTRTFLQVNFVDSDGEAGWK